MREESLVSGEGVSMIKLNKNWTKTCKQRRALSGLGQKERKKLRFMINMGGVVDEVLDQDLRLRYDVV
jgi:hypothetical protein